MLRVILITVIIRIIAITGNTSMEAPRLYRAHAGRCRWLKLNTCRFIRKPIA